MKKKDFTYEIKEEKAVIGKWLGEEAEVFVPECLEGYPVTELGAYVFSGGPYRRIHLPRSLKKIGRYGFYNCFGLEYLKFYTSIEDVGAGAFTGCHQMKELDVTEAGGGRSCFRDVLSEFSEELHVRYHGEGEASLMFPEFYEEGVENTPARILMTQVHGSGLYYRNCFRDGRLKFGEYDSRFGMAKAQETEEFLLRLALGRLYYPLFLEEAAQAEYRAYIKEHLLPAGALLIKGGEREMLLWLAGDFPKGESKHPVFESWVLRAQQEERLEILSCLMEFGRARFPKKRREFTL